MKKQITIILTLLLIAVPVFGQYGGQVYDILPPYKRGFVEYSGVNSDVVLRTSQMLQAQYERDEEIKKEKTIAYMNQVKLYYASVTEYPANIPNGWHKVVSTNNYDFCEERNVYVDNGKVIKYFVDNQTECKILLSTKITNAKAMLQLTSGGTTTIVDIYFLQSIYDQQ